MSPQADRNKEIVRELTEQVWNRCAVDRIAHYYSPNYVADYRPLAPLREGHDGIRGMVERAWAAFPDYHEELSQLVAEGSQVVARFTITGTLSGQWGLLPPTGERDDFDEIVVLELRDGKLLKQSGVSDRLAALSQLGVLPGQGS